MDGIRSKENVQQYGEVFTPDSIVNDMIKLVDDAFREEGITPEEYISKTYLEPACGDGQFLVRILDRKLAAIKNYIPRENWELSLVKAVASIYGVDIQGENVNRSKQRMLELIKTGTTRTFDLPNKEIKSFTNLGMELSDKLESIINSILDKNIQKGNTLEKDDEKSVNITEYIFNGEMVTMTDYKLSHLDGVGIPHEPIHYLSMDGVEQDDGTMDTYDF